MPRFAANLNWMFQEWPLADRFDAAAEAGFTAVEVLLPVRASGRTSSPNGCDATI